MDSRLAEAGAAAREGQTRDQLRTLQGKLLGVVAENDALRAAAAMLLDDLQQVQAAVAGSGVQLASALLSDESAMHALDCLLNCREAAHVEEDLDCFADGLEGQLQQEDTCGAGAGNGTAAGACQADVQLLKLIQMKRSSPVQQHAPRPPLKSHASSGSSNGRGSIAALKAQLKVLHDERDLARLQASALKASRDQLLAHTAAERAQADSQQQRMQSMYEDLAGDASKLKADFDAMAGEREVLKAGFDAQKAAYDKLGADSAQLKADYDAMEGGATLLKAGYDRLALDATGLKQGYDIQEARYARLQVDAAELKQGYDSLATANQQMVDDAAGNQASFDLQKASYDKLQVDATELKSGYDMLSAANGHLVEDAALKQGLFDLQKASYDKLQVDAAALKTGFDGLASANHQLTEDAIGSKALVDKLQVDATEFKSMYDAQKADFDQLATDAGDMKAAYDTQKANYDTLLVDAAELKQGYDGLAFTNQQLTEEAVGNKASYDKLQEDATEFKSMYDTQKIDFDQLTTDAGDMKAAYDTQKADFDILQVDAAELKQGYDGLATANQQLAEDAAGNKASFDKLQVDAAELKTGFDQLTTSNLKLESDAVCMKSAFDNQTALVEKLQVDSAALNVEKDLLAENVVGLQGTNAVLQAQQEHLKRQHELLQAELDFQALRSSKAIIDSGTPADKILHMMTELMDGSIPTITDILYVQSALLESHNIYKPLRLKQQIMQSDLLEEDVSRALIAQLGDDSSDPLSCDALSLEDLCNHRNGRRTAGSSTVGISPEDPNSLPSVVTWMMTAGGALGAGAQQQMMVRASLGAPEPPLYTVVEEALATAGEWDFDAFRLADITHGSSLSVLAFYLFHERDFIAKFKLDVTALARFLKAIEGGYSSTNPYHNATHAADVLQTLHMLLHQGGLVPGYADQLTVMACYVAAIVHDYDHGGFTNDYLVASGHDLSILYNDRAPLENHHAAAAFRLLRRPEYNFLAALSGAEQARFRKLVIDMVLATDMKQHFAILSQFTTIHRLSAPGMSSPSSRSADANRRSMSSCRSYVSDSAEDQIMLPLDEGERLLSLQVALKCADIGHLAATLEVHQRWVGRLEEEFFQQGDAEKRGGLPVSALFDREKPGVTKSQVGFFDIVAMPLFHNYTRVFSSAKPLFNNVVHNYNYWAAVQSGVKQGRVST